MGWPVVVEAAAGMDSFCSLPAWAETAVMVETAESSAVAGVLAIRPTAETAVILAGVGAAIPRAPANQVTVAVAATVVVVAAVPCTQGTVASAEVAAENPVQTTRAVAAGRSADEERQPMAVAQQLRRLEAVAPRSGEPFLCEATTARL